jgi:hypothetical protein
MGVVAMIFLTLVALSIVLIGLQCKRLTYGVSDDVRATIELSPETLRALLAEVHRDYPAQVQA